MAFRKGYQAELELLHFLEQKGFFAVRIPISGGRGFPCDILATDGKDNYAYEVKSTKNNIFYFSEKKLKPFFDFCKKFNFKSLVAIRWKYRKKDPWTFIEVKEIKSLKIQRNVIN